MQAGIGSLSGGGDSPKIGAEPRKVDNVPLSDDIGSLPTGNDPMFVDIDWLQGGTDWLQADNGLVSDDSDPVQADNGWMSSGSDPMRIDSESLQGDSGPLPPDRGLAARRHVRLQGDIKAMSVDIRPMSASKACP
jgi:hypothetical protein